MLRLGRIAIGVLCVLICGCATARASPSDWQRVVLVELFTSQGCSSCPAADAFVRELPARGYGRAKVVPLTFHVDYWDGLGWKDRFAAPRFTARQEWYARATRLRPPEDDHGISGLYTPQMIVDGRVHFSGRREQLAVREIERAAKAPPLFELTPHLAIQGSTVEVTVGLGARRPVPDGQRWALRAALVARHARTPVTHGENAGETLEEAAVVRVLSDPIPIAATMTAPLRLAKPDDVAWADLDVVVFAQSDTGAVGATVQAAVD